MAEKRFIAVHNFLRDRDAYGFALRPQHVKKYHEYADIYTEEETERAEKWKNFLDRQQVPLEPLSSEDEFQDTFQADGSESGDESVSEKEDSRKGKQDSGYLSESEPGGRDLEQDSPAKVGQFLKEREHAEEGKVSGEHQVLREKSLGRQSEHTKDTEQPKPEKEKESAVKSDSDEEKPEPKKEKESSVESGSDEERPESKKKKDSSIESDSDEEKPELEKKQSAVKSDSDEEKPEPEKKKESAVKSDSDEEQLEPEKKKESSVKSDSDEEKPEPEKERESSVESESDEEKPAPEKKESSVEESDEAKAESKKKKESSFESDSDEEKPAPEKKEESSVKSDSDEEKQSKSVKEAVDDLHIQQENETEKPVVGCGLEHETGKKETKPRSVIKWAQIRPCLTSIEAMMCTRVKNVNYMKNKQNTLAGDHASLLNKPLSSIGESEQSSGEKENERDTQTSTGKCDPVKEENDVSPELFFPWYEELEVLVRLGVPKDLRGEVWQAFVGVKARRVEKYYQNLLAQITDSEENSEHPNSSEVQRKWKKQIEKDIPRTFPGHPALNENGRDSLRRILLAYACHNPSVGYCQAMNFFAGLLLLLMPEENAFWTLVGVIDDYFDGYYTEEMIESQVDQLVFEELMRERFPKLVNHLDYLGVQVAWISGPWFLSIFVNILPWECVLRMWDVLLFEGNRVVLFRTAFALMELYGPAIVATQDAGDAITTLQALASSTFDSSQLVLTACMGYLSTNEARLEELREIHRPAILEIVEERIQKGRIWKDKKGLASKLYSFKHEGSILDEQKSTHKTDGENPDSPSASLNVDGSNVDSELDSLPDLQEQVTWLKVELCRLLEEKRSAVLRAEELEIALMEMVKEDNRLELSARIEELDNELSELKEVLSDKKEQEAAMLQVLMKVEQDQKVTEDARISAEQDAAAQRYAVHMLQEKNEDLATQLAQMEKRLVTAETTLEATLQYESGQNKALSSPRFAPTQASPQETLKKRTGFLSFGLGWRERNKAKPAEESNDDNSTNATSEVKDSASVQGGNPSKESKSEDLLNLETKR